MADRPEETENQLTDLLILASSSPRRREIVKALDLSVKIVNPQSEEDSAKPSEKPHEFVLRLSKQKAHHVLNQLHNGIVIAADTTVAMDNTIMGKPASGAEATQMLLSLKGRGHSVLTGITVLDVLSRRQISTYKTTEVTMRHYSNIEIAAYVSSGKPLDRAGGYGIQDEGFGLVEHSNGCYLNAVGLPLCEVIPLLATMGVKAKVRQDWRPPKQCLLCPLGNSQGRCQT